MEAPEISAPTIVAEVPLNNSPEEENCPVAIGGQPYHANIGDVGIIVHGVFLPCEIGALVGDANLTVDAPARYPNPYVIGLGAPSIHQTFLRSYNYAPCRPVDNAANADFLDDYLTTYGDYPEAVLFAHPEDAKNEGVFLCVGPAGSGADAYPHPDLAGTPNYADSKLEFASSTSVYPRQNYPSTAWLTCGNGDAIDFAQIASDYPAAWTGSEHRKYLTFRFSVWQYGRQPNYVGTSYRQYFVPWQLRVTYDPAQEDPENPLAAITLTEPDIATPDYDRSSNYYAARGLTVSQVGNVRTYSFVDDWVWSQSSFVVEVGTTPKTSWIVHCSSNTTYIPAPTTPELPVDVVSVAVKFRATKMTADCYVAPDGAGDGLTPQTPGSIDTIDFPANSTIMAQAGDYYATQNKVWASGIKLYGGFNADFSERVGKSTFDRHYLGYYALEELHHARIVYGTDGDAHSEGAYLYANNLFDCDFIIRSRGGLQSAFCERCSFDIAYEATNNEEFVFAFSGHPTMRDCQTKVDYNYVGTIDRYTSKCEIDIQSNDARNCTFDIDGATNVYIVGNKFADCFFDVVLHGIATLNSRGVQGEFVEIQFPFKMLRCVCNVEQTQGSPATERTIGSILFPYACRATKFKTRLINNNGDYLRPGYPAKFTDDCAFDCEYAGTVNPYMGTPAAPANPNGIAYYTGAGAIPGWGVPVPGWTTPAPGGYSLGDYWE